MSQMKDAVRERKQKQQMNEMISGANENVLLSEQQKEVHYNEMMKAVEKKDFKRARTEARWYQFMDRLTNMSQRFANLLGDQNALMQTFGTMDKVNKNFRQFCKLTRGNISTKSIKNLKKLGTMMARYESDMDKMMSSFDSMFDQPKKKKKKKGEPEEPEVSDEERFYALLGGDEELRGRFNGASGENVAPTERPSQSGSSDLGHGGPSFGVGSPDD